MPEELGNFTAPDRLAHLVRLLTDDGKNNHRFENFVLLNSSKWILAGGFPKECIQYYGYPSASPVYVFILEEDDVRVPHLHVRTPSCGHDSELLERSLKAVLTELQPAVHKHGMLVLEADTTVRAAFFKLQREGAPFETEYSGDFLPFYMNEEHKNEILKMDFTAPKGYEVSVVNAAKDYAFIHKMWPHGDRSRDITTIQRLEHLPSVCIRDSQGELVSWEITYTLGVMNHLFTVEQHRGKGLGALTENLLSQILVREGLNVFKYVADTNVNVVKSTLKHPLWSEWKWKPLDGNDNQDKREEEEIMWSFNAFRYTGN